MYINDNDDIAGNDLVSETDTEGFLRTSDGTVTEFPGLDFSGINNSGTVVGVTLTGPLHAFPMTRDGTIAYIDAPGADETFPTAINTAGDVTGIYIASGGKEFLPFLRYSDGTYLEDALAKLRDCRRP